MFRASAYNSKFKTYVPTILTIETRECMCFYFSSCSIDRHGTIAINNESSGVAWLKNKIYVVGLNASARFYGSGPI